MKPPAARPAKVPAPPKPAAKSLTAQEQRAALNAERRRERVHSNERARAFANALANLAVGILIAGLVVPLFDKSLAHTPATVATTFLASGLISVLVYIISGFVEPEHF